MLYLISFEKKIIPIIQPEQKIKIIFRFSKINGFFKADVINSYLPKIRRINAPLNPGRIIAHIAIIPQKNIKKEPSAVFNGISPEITNDIVVPSIRIGKILRMFLMD